MSKLSSPFHLGEQILQTQVGVRDRMEKFGSRVIRDHMPSQHRDFYQQQPFVIAAHVDGQGWPWASILFGEKPDFIQSPDDKTLIIHPQLAQGHPFAHALSDNQPIGVLGIELSSRRRNRLATHIKHVTGYRISLQVDQSFGNCPQYIQTREIRYLKESERLPLSVHPLDALDPKATDLIAKSDTFFVASYFDSGDNAASNGADASHRGGKPGFVHIDENGVLTIPDYAGNNHFNTLGNLLKNPRAGLLFVDFETGHCLSLTGRTEILLDSPLIKHFNGAQRLWQFRMEKGVWLKNLLPFRFAFQDYSPNTLMTGNWQQAHRRLARATRQDQWRELEINKVVDESSDIKSFYLQDKQDALPAFRAGQFLPIQLQIEGKTYTRTYSLSSAPDDPFYRISVKRDGLVSGFMHDNLTEGSMLSSKAPTGTFTLQSERPSVFIAAGIGVTPFVSMLRQAKLEQSKLHKHQQLTLFFQTRSESSRPMFDELNQLVQGDDAGIQVIWSMSQPESHLELGRDFHYHGHIDKPLLQGVLTLDDYDFFICGPGQFMQQQYNNLLALGVSDNRIFAEAFGSGALQRGAPASNIGEQFVPKYKAAQQAEVRFEHAQTELIWAADQGTLLDFAENHGIQAESSCRSGQCGSCKVKVLQGQVSHTQHASFPVEDDEALLCCSVPAQPQTSSDRLILAL